MRILLADDHPLFREGVKPVLRKLNPPPEIYEAVDYPSAFEAMRRHGEVDLALLDLYMPGMEALDGVRRFRAAFPTVPLAVLSASEQIEDIRALFQCGAMGFICKSSSSDQILAALRQILQGLPYAPAQWAGTEEAEAGAERLRARYPTLTSRHIEVLRQLTKGLSNRQIGAALAVTEGTVKIHVAAIFRILKVNNRTEAVLIAQKMGLDRGN